MNSQEALDLLMFYPRIIEREGSVSVKNLSEAYTTLQELIDNYEKALRLCVIETKEKIIVEKALDKACEDVYYCTQNCSSFAFCNVCKFNGEECQRGTAECLDDPFREKEKGIELVKQFYLESEKE